VLGERIDFEFVLPNRLKIPKSSRAERDKIDEKSKAYVKIDFAKLRYLKALVLDAYQTKKNQPKEQRV